MAKKKTFAGGAVVERSLVRRWAKRELEKSGVLGDSEGTYVEGFELALNRLLDWLKSQPKRTKKRGGIGRS